MGCVHSPLGSVSMGIVDVLKVFSGTIISSVIPNGDIKRTAEWQLLLAAIALPGMYILLTYRCSSFGPFRRFHRGCAM